MVHSKLMIGLIPASLSSSIYPQNNDYSSFFISYETMEITMNKFQNFAREVGCRFNDKNQVRLMFGKVKLTERHLSSSWEAAAVERENVEG